MIMDEWNETESKTNEVNCCSFCNFSLTKKRENKCLFSSSFVVFFLHYMVISINHLFQFLLNSFFPFVFHLLLSFHKKYSHSISQKNNNENCIWSVRHGTNKNENNFNEICGKLLPANRNSFGKIWIVFDCLLLLCVFLIRFNRFICFSCHLVLQ